MECNMINCVGGLTGIRGGGFDVLSAINVLAQ